MTDWICVRDRHRLDRRAAGLRCPHCAQEVPLVEGVAVFDGKTETAGPSPSALLDELWRLMQGRSADEAAETFCRDRGVSRDGLTADWPGFIPAENEGRVLEIGAGFGDDTLALGRQAAEVVSLVPHLRNGMIVRRHLDQTPRANVAVAVVEDLARLPLEDGSIDTIAMEESAAAGFGVSARTLGGIAAEWKRVLTPSGRVALGLSNRLHARLGLDQVWSRIGPAPRPESLNRLIRRAAGGGPFRRLGLRPALRGLRRQGFRRPTVYAPLPDPGRVEIVLPIEDAGVVRHCLDQTLRRNSRVVRSAISLAHLAARLDLLRTVVPYYYLISELEPGRR